MNSVEISTGARKGLSDFFDCSTYCVAPTIFAYKVYSVHYIYIEVDYTADYHLEKWF